MCSGFLLIIDLLVKLSGINWSFWDIRQGEFHFYRLNDGQSLLYRTSIYMLVNIV
jgi:hypothetical protein